MEEMTLTDILSICIQHNLPFYSYRMPYNEEIRTGIQLSQQIKHFSGFENLPEGFVVSPFDTKSRAEPLFIQSDISFRDDNIESEQLKKLLSITFEVKNHRVGTPEISKEEYLLQAHKLIGKLKKGDFKKVVLSRAIHNNSYNIHHAPFIFNQLTQTYPHAFVSVFHIPGHGIWLGATPETLLKSDEKSIQTMSLAATKSANQQVEWTDKEREEQEMVSDFVEYILQQFPFKEIKKEGPLEQNAGNVCHLMTQYTCEGELTKKERYKLIGKLHPTPAVCGIPKEASLKLIRHTEKHDREYYAGYIGPIDKTGCHLFVNLRCMKLTSDRVTFFVGGGLTAQSDPEAEWQETCLKLETLTKIIKND